MPQQANPTQVDFRTIADLSYETDPDTAGGYVAEAGNITLARSYCEQLEAAGFEASYSSDEQGRGFVWVIAEESDDEEEEEDI